MKELKFIHITKTGGTTIEDVGKKNGKKWGRFHKEYYTDFKSVAPWHTKFYLLSNDLKLKYDWFTVVRNPYERIISEFYCRYGGWGISNKFTCSKKEFNKILKARILAQRNNIGDHYTPQHFYIDPNIKIHIIKFENLTKEFNELMKKYNYNIRLNKHSNKGKKIYTVNDLSNEVISLINNIYHKDFEMFGYKKIIKN